MSHDASVPMAGDLYLLHTWISVWSEVGKAGSLVGMTATLETCTILQNVELYVVFTNCVFCHESHENIVSTLRHIHSGQISSDIITTVRCMFSLNIILSYQTLLVSYWSL